MVMILVFVIVILAGLVLFFLTLKKELGGGQPAGSLSLRPNNLDLPKTTLLSEPVAVPSPAEEESAVPPGVPAAPAEDKYAQLEKMMSEKNRLLETIQDELRNERAHRGEFESLRAILQQQIEDLKAQNKKYKDELSKALQENQVLQRAVKESERSGKGEKADVIVASDPILSDEKEAAPEPAPRLYDVFSTVKKDNEGEKI